MAIITSWAVGVDTNANRPAAGTAGRLFYETDTGLAWYDNGSNWIPYLHYDSHPMRAVFQTGDSWTLAVGTGEAMGGANFCNRHKRSFIAYRQARIYARCKNRATSAGNVGLNIYDITNSQVITPDATFSNSGAWAQQTSTWGNLNSATYAGDAEFEVQIGSSGSAGDTIEIGTVILELR